MGKQKLDVDRLTRLAAKIDELIGHRFIDLVHSLEVEEGLKLYRRTGWQFASMAGVRSSAKATDPILAGERNALIAWASKARRAANQQ